MLSLFASLAKRKQFVVIVTCCLLLLRFSFLNAHNECLNRPLLVWVSTPPAALLSKPLQLLFNLDFCVYGSSLSHFVMLLFFTCLSLDKLKIEEYTTRFIQKRWIVSAQRGAFYVTNPSSCWAISLRACIFACVCTSLYETIVLVHIQLVHTQNTFLNFFKPVACNVVKLLI